MDTFFNLPQTLWSTVSPLSPAEPQDRVDNLSFLPDFCITSASQAEVYTFVFRTREWLATHPHDLWTRTGSRSVVIDDWSMSNDLLTSLIFLRLSRRRWSICDIEGRTKPVQNRTTNPARKILKSLQNSHDCAFLIKVHNSQHRKQPALISGTGWSTRNTRKSVQAGEIFKE